MMSNDDFLSVENLLQSIAKRKTDAEKTSSVMAEMQWINTKTVNHSQSFLKKLFGDVAFYKLDFKPYKKGHSLSIANILQTMMYRSLQTVTKEKKKEMEDLSFIPPVHRHYFEGFLIIDNVDGNKNNK